MLFQRVSIALLPHQSFARSNELIHQLHIICAVQVNTAGNVFQRSYSVYISWKLVVNPLSANVMRSQVKVLIMCITYAGDSFKETSASQVSIIVVMQHCL